MALRKHLGDRGNGPKVGIHLEGRMGRQQVRVQPAGVPHSRAGDRPVHQAQQVRDPFWLVQPGAQAQLPDE
jgi:hypothetical protein